MKWKFLSIERCQFVHKSVYTDQEFAFTPLIRQFNTSDCNDEPNYIVTSRATLNRVQYSGNEFNRLTLIDKNSENKKRKEREKVVEKMPRKFLLKFKYISTLLCHSFVVLSFLLLLFGRRDRIDWIKGKYTTKELILFFPRLFFSHFTALTSVDWSERNWREMEWHRIQWKEKEEWFIRFHSLCEKSRSFPSRATSPKLICARIIFKFLMFSIHFPRAV